MSLKIKTLTNYDYNDYILYIIIQRYLHLYTNKANRLIARRNIRLGLNIYLKLIFLTWNWWNTITNKFLKLSIKISQTKHDKPATPNYPSRLPHRNRSISIEQSKSADFLRIHDLEPRPAIKSIVNSKYLCVLRSLRLWPAFRDIARGNHRLGWTYCWLRESWPVTVVHVYIYWTRRLIRPSHRWRLMNGCLAVVVLGISGMLWLVGC